MKFLRSTHLVCAFQYKQEAVKFYKALGERLEKFGLELAQEKTNLIIFSRFRQEEKTKFEFLGFEFRWGVSREGKVIIKRRTAPGKLRKSIIAFTDWCKKMRSKRLRKLFPKLIAKLRGYTNYYGLIGNFRSLSKFYEHVKRIFYKWLNRRSQRRSFNLAEFDACWERYGVPKPRIVESDLVQLGYLCPSRQKGKKVKRAFSNQAAVLNMYECTLEFFYFHLNINNFQF